MEHLFNSFDLPEVLRQQAEKAREEINKAPEDYVLGVSETDYIAHLKKEYSVEALQLGEPFVESSKEADIDVSNNALRVHRFRHGPIHVRGMEVKIKIPYTGDPVLLRCRPSESYVVTPMASFVYDHLELSFKGEGLTGEWIRSEVDRTVGEIRKYLVQIEAACKRHNDSLEEVARQCLQSRKQRLLNNRQIVANIGLPLKKRSDSQQTYTVPDIRRKADIKPPVVKEKAFVPEPVLAEQEYENILTIIRSMVRVMERSPKAFATLGEEDIRFHFLIQLNGHYEGRASGETFNYSGKTDILIREKDRNAFIAECKIWKGEGELRKATDQLLGYLHWRDTKTALLIFNRNKSFSDVLQKAKEAVQGHPCCKKLIKQVSETEWHFLFRNVDDANRELTLALLLFDVPRGEPP